MSGGASEPDVDVLVVGGGGAGLAAAATAAEAGARVLVLEATDRVGGSMLQSAGMFTAAGTSVQAALGIEDSPERFFQHYMDLNQWRLEPGLVRAFCRATAPTFEWLLGLGLDVPAAVSGNAHQPGLCRAGVEDVWRGHAPRDQGQGVVDVLDRARRRLGVDVALGARVRELVVEDGAVVGVQVDGEQVRAARTVVTTGGLAHDRAMVARWYPAALAAGDDLFVVAGEGSRGDHLRLGAQVGAAVAGEGWGLLVVTAYFQSCHHWDAGFPPASRIVVDGTGRRFMDEDASYAVAAGIVDDHGGHGWMVFDEAARRALPTGYRDWTPDNVLAEVAAGRTHRADDVEGLARAAGLPPEALCLTVSRWNEQLPHGVDPDYLRHETLRAKGADPHLAPVAEPPFYAVRALPAQLVVTHAGLRIDPGGRVVDEVGRVVPGLLAAGEAGGGVLGARYVGGGNAIANALTMGRVAATTAVRGLSPAADAADAAPRPAGAAR